MIARKKPREQSPSPLVLKFGQEIALCAPGPILDVACGYGRNAAYLASFGVPVVCLDHDPKALEFVAEQSRVPGTGPARQDLLRTRNIDLVNAPWPFADSTIGAIILVHFWMPRLVEHFAKALAVGGYLLVETIEGRGRNYLALPPQGYFEAVLADGFDFRYLKEKRAGPASSNSATVKLLAVKRRCFNFTKGAKGERP